MQKQSSNPSECRSEAKILRSLARRHHEQATYEREVGRKLDLRARRLEERAIELEEKQERQMRDMQEIPALQELTWCPDCNDGWIGEGVSHRCGTSQYAADEVA